MAAFLKSVLLGGAATTLVSVTALSADTPQALSRSFGPPTIMPYKVGDIIGLHDSPHQYKVLGYSGHGEKTLQAFKTVSGHPVWVTPSLSEAQAYALCNTGGGLRDVPTVGVIVSRLGAPPIPRGQQLYEGPHSPLLPEAEHDVKVALLHPVNEDTDIRNLACLQRMASSIQKVISDKLP